MEYPSVTAYGRAMSTPAVVPGPRSALDEGSVHDLCLDGAQVVLPVTVPRPQPRRAPYDVIVVPDDAPALMAGLSQYGS